MPEALPVWLGSEMGIKKAQICKAQIQALSTKVSK